MITRYCLMLMKEPAVVFMENPPVLLQFRQFFYSFSFTKNFKKVISINSLLNDDTQPHKNDKTRISIILNFYLRLQLFEFSLMLGSSHVTVGTIFISFYLFNHTLLMLKLLDKISPYTFFVTFKKLYEWLSGSQIESDYRHYLHFHFCVLTFSRTSRSLPYIYYK